MTASPTHRIAHWLIADTAVAHLRTAGMSDAELRTDLGSKAYVIGSGTSSMPNGWSGLRVRSYASEAKLESDIAAGTVGADAVIYDNEAWSLTPTNEQASPAIYEARAAAAAHHHGLALINTPAVDLVRVLSQGGSASRYDTYLSLGILRDAAQHADVVDIQAQGAEASLPTYVAFVKAAATQARAANPHVIVLAGLSTNPSGQNVTAQQLEAAVAGTRDAVDGYWLNIPSPGSACPQCGTPQPQVAVELLRSLSADQPS